MLSERCWLAEAKPCSSLTLPFAPKCSSLPLPCLLLDLREDLVLLRQRVPQTWNCQLFGTTRSYTTTRRHEQPSAVCRWLCIRWGSTHETLHSDLHDVIGRGERDGDALRPKILWCSTDDFHILWSVSRCSHSTVAFCLESYFSRIKENAKFSSFLKDVLCHKTSSILFYFDSCGAKRKHSNLLRPLRRLKGFS